MGICSHPWLLRFRCCLQAGCFLLWNCCVCVSLRWGRVFCTKNPTRFQAVLFLKQIALTVMTKAMMTMMMMLVSMMIMMIMMLNCCFFMQRRTIAMTIAMLITTSITMLLPVAAVFLLLVRRPQLQKSCVLWAFQTKTSITDAQLKQTNNDIHGETNTFAHITLEKKNMEQPKTSSYSRKPPKTQQL